MVRKNFSRILKQFTFVILAAALVHGAFAQEHGKVFPITTTATSYSTENNSYDAASTSSGVRLVFVAPKTGIFNVKFVLDSTAGDYYVSKCVDDTYVSCSLVFEVYYSSYTSRSEIIRLAKGDSVFYLLNEYSTAYSKYLLNVSYEEIASYNVKIKGTTTLDTAVERGYSLTIKAFGLVPTGEAFINWKLDKGSGTFYDSSLASTTFTPASDVEISIVSKPFTIHPLTDKEKSFVYKNDGVAVGSGYGVRTSYKSTDTACYILHTETDYYNYLRNYGTDGSFLGTYVERSFNSGPQSYLFCLNAGETYYFDLLQTYSSNVTDIVKARVEKGVKINADTTGSGYVYVGGSSFNYDSTHVIGDSVLISAYAYSGARFDHWEKVSGKCSIIDSTKAATRVVLKGESCRVEAIFVEGMVYSITTKSNSYSTANNYFSQSASNGVRFKFIAPSDGAYAISFKGADATELYTIYRYPNSAFSSYTWGETAISSKVDSVLLSKNDTLYYLVKNYNYYDSLNVFSVKYSSIASYKVTLKSASAQCTTSVASDTVVGGVVSTYFGYAASGYRPNGFKIKKGTATIVDSLPGAVKIKASSDVTLELQCGVANLIDITTKETYYTPNKDFYEKDSTSGMRYRYIAPTTSTYIVRAKTKVVGTSYFYGYYYYYGADSTFNYTSNSYYVSNNTPSQNVVVQPTSKGESFYFYIKPYGSTYYDDSVAVYAIKASVVTVEGKATPDTIVAKGDSVSVNAFAILDTGYNFINWKIVSGSGKFVDSTKVISTFIPSSDSAKIAVNKKKGQIYPLTDKYSGFTYYANGSKVTSLYGIRTYYIANDTGTYVLVTKSANPWYVYDYSADSTFYSYYTSRSKASTYTDDTLRYPFYVGTANTSRYFLLYNGSDPYAKDSIWAKVVKTARITSDTVGGGYVRMTGGYEYDYSHIDGDTIFINATPNTDQRFDHWKVASGKCTIIDSTERYTRLAIKGDCKVVAYFRDGIIYPITATPTEYTTAKDYYVVSASHGVRFNFVAPSAGTYAFVSSWAHSGTLVYYRYTDNTYSTSAAYKSSTMTNVDTLTMNAGDSAFFLVYPSSVYDSLVPFWISYSTSKVLLELVGDSTGSVSPAKYDPAWKGSKYAINAYANVGYRFDYWEMVSGSATIDDSDARMTLVTMKGSAKVKAHFRKSIVQQLTKKKKTFNYKSHYYSDRTGSAVYFTWTPPDTSWYMVHIESTEPLSAKWFDFGTDTTFLTYSSTGYSVTPSAIGETSATFLFKPTSKDPLYWAMVDSVANRLRDQAFTIQIATPYVLTVSSDAKGRVSPSGEVAVFPGADTVVSAIAYGGYIFDKWVKVSGKVTIDDPTNTKTRVKPNSELCEIEATYSLDLSTEPVLTITDLDLSDFPGICAGVIVKDKNTDKSIAGLDSSDFVLYQDNKAQPIQVTSMQGISGVSVAIVVDESGSMSGTRILQAKESIRQYINEMSAFDRTAIVGFDGSRANVHQTMTSDKNLLLQATEGLRASGGTNILDGAYGGLQQIVGETNPTAVIVFSDGDDGSNSVTSQAVIDYAKSLNTVIHSVAIGYDYKVPLETIALGTGGSYTFAPSAAQLAAIYISIRNSVQARYTICYESPDTVVNGDEHEVVIKTKFLNKTASDTAYWSEKFMPPVVKLTKNTKKLIGAKQTPGDSITISVYVSSVDSLASVVLYTRTSSPNTAATYTAHPMTHVKDSLWTYVVPGYNAVAPGIDFYVIATNVSGMVGKSPQVPTPSNEPYTIPIGNKAPAIEFMSVACVDTTGDNGELTFTIKDDDGIASSKIYYRTVGTVVFKEKKMTRVTKKGDDWSVSLLNSTFRAGELEFYVRAIDKLGVSARWEKFDNNYIEACRDSNAMVTDVSDTIRILNGEKEGKEITRLTDAIALSLVTEDFTSKRDTVTVSLSCLVSGDVEDDIKMVEVRSGYFETQKPLEKNEYAVKKNDGKISCAATDTLVATYKDPLYGTKVRDSVAIGDDVPLVYQFMDEKCKTDLDSVQTSTTAKFCLKVQAPSPSLYERDTLKLLLFTDQGDTIRVEAVESADYSKEYLIKNSFFFVEDSASLKDSLLDAVLDLDTTFNRVVIQGGTTSDKSKLRKRDSLVIFTNYVAADFAEIYDSDLDGKADSIRIHFKKPLKKKVASIDTVYWNAAQGSWTNVESKKIHITEDSSWVEAMVRKPFKYGRTAIDTSAPPYLRVTKTKSEFSQKTMLKDKVGAVPLRAVKRPGQITMEEYLDASDDVAPDTLVITMSEGIKNTGKKTAWKDLFRYSKTCEDTAYSPIRSKFDPIVDSAGIVWKFVLADYAIMKDNCISTNPEATYVDSEGNSMGRGGVEIEGRDETVYLYEVSAVQPVHGIGKKGKWIPQGGNSWEDVPDSLTVIKIASVAPYEANIYIYDNLANVVANMKQKFGDNGEMESKIRGNDKNRAKIGYLTWNHRSNRDRKVATGVYIWRIDFKFKDGHTEYRILKTGYLRREE